MNDTKLYFIITGILSVLMIIVLIIGSFVKVKIPGAISSVNMTNCSANVSTNPYISNINIGWSAKPGMGVSNNYCPTSGGIGLPICDQSGTCGTYTFLNGENNDVNNPVQVCYSTDENVCDQSLIVTDVKFSDMTDGNTYQLPQYRCSGDSTFFPPLSINIDNASTSDVGKLPNRTPGCAKMGLCVQQQPLGTAKQYLPANNIKFVAVPANTPWANICTNFGPGFQTDGVNLYKNCADDKNLEMYICKKFETK